MMVLIQSIVLGLLALTSPTVYALRTLTGSPCTQYCGDTSNTTASEISCTDGDYNSTATGEAFESCVSCLLSSDYEEPLTLETDVSWGLYNLRYAFSSCVYGYPKVVTNISTPCLVSCTMLGPALETNLIDPSYGQLSNYCNTSSFPDNAVTTCEQCYALAVGPTGQQAFLANFLEAVRYNCHFPTTPGVAFAISPNRIFNETELPTTTTAYGSTATATGLSTFQKFKTLIIVMPIIGFLIIVAATGLCCFCCIRHRRKLAKRRRHNSNNIHNRWNPAAFNAPWMPAWSAQPASPYQQQFVMENAVPFGGVIPGNGFEVMEHDGKTYEAGYSNHYVSPVSPEGSESQQQFFGSKAAMAQEEQQRDVKTQVVYQQTETNSESPQEFFPPPNVPHAL